MTGWLCVFAAGLAEVAGAVAMNAIRQRAGPLAYARLVACFALSFGLLPLGLKRGISISICGSASARWVRSSSASCATANRSGRCDCSSWRW